MQFAYNKIKKNNIYYIDTSYKYFKICILKINNSIFVIFNIIINTTLQYYTITTIQKLFTLIIGKIQ